MRSTSPTAVCAKGRSGCGEEHRHAQDLPSAQTGSKMVRNTLDNRGNKVTLVRSLPFTRHCSMRSVLVFRSSQTNNLMRQVLLFSFNRWINWSLERLRTSANFTHLHSRDLNPHLSRPTPPLIFINIFRGSEIITSEKNVLWDCEIPRWEKNQFKQSVSPGVQHRCSMFMKWLSLWMNEQKHELSAPMIR